MPEPSIRTCPSGLDTIPKSVLAGAAMRLVAEMRLADTRSPIVKGDHHAIPPLGALLGSWHDLT
jgi:hypothetical protein